MAEFYFTPELHLRDGRIIRDLDDAANFAREHEALNRIVQQDAAKWRQKAGKSSPDKESVIGHPVAIAHAIGDGCNHSEAAILPTHRRHTLPSKEIPLFRARGRPSLEP